jgi:MFS family permease
LQATGSAIQPNTSSVIVSIIALMSTYGSTLAVDRLGRKFLLLVSVVVMGISTLLIGAFFLGKDFNYDVSPVSFIPLVSLCTFIVAFSVGIGPVTWIMMGEIFPVQIKGEIVMLR